jgi:hypothetical protein
VTLCPYVRGVPHGLQLVPHLRPARFFLEGVAAHTSAVSAPAPIPVGPGPVLVRDRSAAIRGAAACYEDRVRLGGSQPGAVTDNLDGTYRTSHSPRNWRLHAWGVPRRHSDLRELIFLERWCVDPLVRGAIVGWREGGPRAGAGAAELLGRARCALPPQVPCAGGRRAHFPSMSRMERFIPAVGVAAQPPTQVHGAGRPDYRDFEQWPGSETLPGLIICQRVAEPARARGAAR